VLQEREQALAEGEILHFRKRTGRSGFREAWRDGGMKGKYKDNGRSFQKEKPSEELSLPFKRILLAN